MKEKTLLEKEDIILEVKDLNIHYQTDLETVNAVNGIDIILKKGEITGIVGETGAGKTTTALAIMQLLPEKISKTSGEIVFEGKNLEALPEAELRQIRGKNISMIFQDPMTSLNPVYTVGEQIREAIKIHNESGRDKKQIEERVDEVLSLVGIPPDRKNDYPHQFSGGMKQRVIIAMALSCEPNLLIADEPTTALDVTIQAQVLMMMRELQDRLGTATILITHDLGIVAQMCDYIKVMYAGEFVESGTAIDIFTSKSHHPYTQGLFGSIPGLYSDQKRLSPIPGLMPDPTNLPKGCKFSPRCLQCMEICETENPKYVTRGTHSIKCHLFFDGFSQKGGEKND